MTPEPIPEGGPSFAAQLESALLHGPVDDAIELMHTASEGSYVRSAVRLQEAMRGFDHGDSDETILEKLKRIERPEAAARCVYELEQRDANQALDILTTLDQRNQHYDDHTWFSQMFDFLKRLRETGDGGSDGGAGVREPHPPHDPRDSGAIALEPPREETVGFDERPCAAAAVIDRGVDH